MTSESYCPECPCIEDVSTDSLSVVSLPDLAEDHSYLCLPQDLKDEFGVSYSFNDYDILEPCLFSTWSAHGERPSFSLIGLLYDISS